MPTQHGELAGGRHRGDLHATPGPHPLKKGTQRADKVPSTLPARPKQHAAGMTLARPWLIIPPMTSRLPAGQLATCATSRCTCSPKYRLAVLRLLITIPFPQTAVTDWERMGESTPTDPRAAHPGRSHGRPPTNTGSQPTKQHRPAHPHPASLPAPQSRQSHRMPNTCAPPEARQQRDRRRRRYEPPSDPWSASAQTSRQHQELARRKDSPGLVRRWRGQDRAAVPPRQRHLHPAGTARRAEQGLRNCCCRLS